LDDAGVFEHEHVFDGEGRDFGQEDAAEGVRDAGVDADEREAGVVLLVLVELDAELVAEARDVPGVVLRRACVSYHISHLGCNSGHFIFLRASP
jgi:hypothetical protein